MCLQIKKHFCIFSQCSVYFPSVLLCFDVSELKKIKDITGGFFTMNSSEHFTYKSVDIELHRLVMILTTRSHKIRRQRNVRLKIILVYKSKASGFTLCCPFLKRPEFDVIFYNKIGLKTDESDLTANKRTRWPKNERGVAECNTKNFPDYSARNLNVKCH